ncbi:TPA: flagellar hook protein FlgE [bacterium]|jgi:flagellar hook protein FlgE|nr:flagellar hook protein FlgE [bacterium]
MMRSLFAGVSGLRNHQVRMDVIANNIANVNTTGYKMARVTFQDLFYQTLKGASAPQGSMGGTDPIQVGLGMTIGGINTIYTPGNPQYTGNPTDFAIQGDGFFIVSDGNKSYFTRDGAFSIGLDGSLVNPNTGYKVLGWRANVSGIIDTSMPVEPLVIPKGQQMMAKATSNVRVVGNLDAQSNTGTIFSAPTTIYDSLGVSHTLRFTFEKTGINQWTVTADMDGISVTGWSSTLVFRDDGVYDPASSIINPVSITPTNGAAPLNITPDFSNMTQLGGDTSISISYQDGYPMGSLTDFTVSETGVITGIYSNGLNQVLGQIALANFGNPGGLTRVGYNLFEVSVNSGEALIGYPGSGGRGNLYVGALEMSNVDLASEFTNMIITQRGFQANSRIITTSDEMLQELVNLKR